MVWPALPQATRAQMCKGAFDGLGQVFVTEAVSHKFHACCHGTHATLEALAQIEVEAKEVTAVTVTVHPRWLKVCNKPCAHHGA